MSPLCFRLRLVLLVWSLSAPGHTEEDWIDPYDMLNYDSGTKTMRKQPEPATYLNVSTKRREHHEEAQDCCNTVSALQREIEVQQKSIASISQQPTCSAVFKRFLTRFLKLIKKVGLPTDNGDSFYNAKVKITKQGVTEIERFLESGDGWRHGAMDDALSQLLVDVKTLDYEAWKWRFEDVFGVDIDTVLKVLLVVLVVVAIICTQLWSVVSWFLQFKRMFAICFFISLVWNWLYLYKIEFAQHQSRLAKVDAAYDKCNGIKKIDWTDSLKEWYRSTWTLQDDPCKKYYEDLMVNPVLLVPPSKAFSVTITTFFTEPLKHVGQGISEFLRALLKDLPITLQLPVLITIVLSILVVMYGGVQAVFQHGIMAPLRLREPARPAAVAEPPSVQVLPPPPPPAQMMLTGQGGGDAPQPRPKERGADGGPRRRRPRGLVAPLPPPPPPAAAAAPRRRPPVETLGDEGYSQDEADQGDGDSEEYDVAAVEEEEMEGEAEVEVLGPAIPRTVAQDASKRAKAKAKPSDTKPAAPGADRQDAVTRGASLAPPDPAPRLPDSTGEQVILGDTFGHILSSLAGLKATSFAERSGTVCGDGSPVCVVLR